MEFPQHERLEEVNGESQVIGQFLDWLQSEEHVTLCRIGEHGHYYPTYERIEQTLANYFGIDLNQLEEEKLEMLKQLRGGRANG